MKRVYMGLLLLFTIIAGMAQDGRQSIQVSNMEVYCNNEKVTLKFVLQAGERSVQSDYSLIVLPVLKHNNDSIVLPEITIQGSRASIAEKRDLLAQGKKKKEKVFSTTNGGKVSYVVTTPYQEWMHFSELIFNGLLTGCCSAKEVVIGSISGHKVPAQSVHFATMKAAVPEEQISTADRLAIHFPFLSSMKLLDHNRDGSLTIYFGQAQRTIDHHYKNNRETLVQLVSVIRMIERSIDSCISEIVIAGYASPEGDPAFNEQLAGDRGVALRNFLMENTSLLSEQIYVYNGSIDWSGLREMVETSDRYDKLEILEIINAPEREEGNRLKKLMSLNDGKPYHYLLNNFFPLLRNAAYVKVYYRNL